MTTPDPSTDRAEVYESVRQSLRGMSGRLTVARVVDMAWPIAFQAGVEEGRRQSRALDPEVAEVVADTIEKFEGRNR